MKTNETGNTMAALLAEDRRVWAYFLGDKGDRPVRRVRKAKPFWSIGDACPQLRNVILTSV